MPHSSYEVIWNINSLKSKMRFAGDFFRDKSNGKFLSFCFVFIMWFQEINLLLYLKNHSIVFGEVENFPL